MVIGKAPNTTIVEFANIVDSDETAHDEASVSSGSLVFNFLHIEFFFLNFADVILSFAFFALYRVINHNLGIIS